MSGISEKNNSGDDRSSGADSGPDCISSSDGDGFHRLGDGKKAEHDENHRDNTRDKLSESLAVF